MLTRTRHVPSKGQEKGMKKMMRRMMEGGKMRKRKKVTREGQDQRKKMEDRERPQERT